MPLGCSNLRSRKHQRLRLVITRGQRTAVYKSSAQHSIIEKQNLHPVRTAMKNSAPAQFPKKPDHNSLEVHDSAPPMQKRHNGVHAITGVEIRTQSAQP
jgi:hypothetical protein